MWIWQPSKVNVLNLAPLDSYAARVVVDVMMVSSNTRQILILLRTAISASILYWIFEAYTCTHRVLCK